MRPLVLLLAVALLGGCTTPTAVATAQQPPRPPAQQGLTYAHTWGGAAPEPWASMHPAVTIHYVSRAELEQWCGRRVDPNGWTQSGCAYGTVIFIGDDVPASVRAQLIEHETAHAAGWPADHPGITKPFGHLDACLATGLALRQMADLCNLDRGQPLRTQEERDRWAGMR